MTGTQFAIEVNVEKENMFVDESGQIDDFEQKASQKIDAAESYENVPRYCAWIRKK